MKLEPRYVQKPWGRTVLPAIFASTGGERIGEVWFTAPEAQPLMVKYLFTSERLSIQVHPNDEQARDRGLPEGKSECWTIVEAEAGAAIGLGLKRAVCAEELRAAALDGSIDELMAWRPVRAGDFFIVPSGTIHAIGGGITLIEFQKNADITYRLYDYGRPRELHLDDGVAVASAKPYPEQNAHHLARNDFATLVHGPDFVFAYADTDQFEDRRRWVIPLEGIVRIGGEIAKAGECLLIQAGTRAECEGRMLIGAMP